MNRKDVVFVALLFVSAVFRALEQIMRWNRELQSWLPEWVFSWDFKFLSTFDAVHVYMGITLIAFGVAFIFVPGNSRIPLWLGVAIVIWLYYQVFNLFYHVIFIWPDFWRWPILLI